MTRPGGNVFDLGHLAPLADTGHVTAIAAPGAPRIMPPRGVAVRPREAAMRVKHTDPYRGLRIMLTTGAITLPILVLLACWIYVTMMQ
jgi:hypothetical protein